MHASSVKAGIRACGIFVTCQTKLRKAIAHMAMLVKIGNLASRGIAIAIIVPSVSSVRNSNLFIEGDSFTDSGEAIGNHGSAAKQNALASTPATAGTIQSNGDGRL